MSERPAVACPRCGSPARKVDVALRAPRWAGLLCILALVLPLVGFVIDNWHRTELGFPKAAQRGTAFGWSIFAAVVLGTLGLAIERKRILRCRACGRRSRPSTEPDGVPTDAATPPVPLHDVTDAEEPHSPRALGAAAPEPPEPTGPAGWRAGLRASPPLAIGAAVERPEVACPRCGSPARQADIVVRTSQAARLLLVVAFLLPFAGFVLDNWHARELGFPRKADPGQASALAILVAVALGLLGLQLQRRRILGCRACGRRSTLPTRRDVAATP
jgi:hypothetical protein